LFEELYKNGFHEKALLLVENITWWVWKNIFKAKQINQHKIIIGWYWFLLYAYANKIGIDHMLIFNINWPSKQSILDDIKRYAFG
jgi:hypothetical protein